MAEVHLGPLPEGTKHCRVCAEPINQDSTKCIHCGSYQTLVRNLGAGTSVLSLLIALASAVTAFVAIVKDNVIEKNSAFVAAFQGRRANQSIIVVSNQGTRSGSIRAGVVFVHLGGLKTRVLRSDSLELVNTNEIKSQPPYIVEPNKSLSLGVTFELPSGGIPEIVAESLCEISLFTVDFYGRSGSTDIFVPCKSFTYLPDAPKK